MAEIKKRGLRTVEANQEELEAEIRRHRRRNLIRGIECFLIVIVLVVAVELLYELKSFSSYEINSSAERTDGGSAQYIALGEHILEVTRDGTSCRTYDHEVAWNQSYEMSTPKAAVCQTYAAVYDRGGKLLYIFGEKGSKQKIETTLPIQTAAVSANGMVAVMMRADGVAQVKLFQPDGKEVANGKFYGEKGSFPLDIALSSDGAKMAVTMVDTATGGAKTTISFYNFGSVGQSEVDNNVGTFSFEDILIPEIAYLDNSRMIGIADGKILVFEGTQKPTLSKEIAVKEVILSYFYNEKYIGIVCASAENPKHHHIRVMDFKGTTVMENEISIEYQKIGFLSNSEICALSETECEIFTLRSIRKFSYDFEKEVCAILANKGSWNYTFIFKETIEEVKLK